MVGAIVLLVLGIILIGIPIAFLIWAVASIWVIYRVIRGYLLFKESKPIPGVTAPADARRRREAVTGGPHPAPCRRRFSAAAATTRRCDRPIAPGSRARSARVPRSRG